MTLSELQAKREALLTAISSGYRKVKFSDREIEYATVQEMKAALSVINGEIAKASSTGSSFTLGSFRKA